TTTTTTEEPKTTSSATTTTTTTEEPKSTVTTTKDKPGLPETGENKGTFVTILGTLILVSSILVVRNSLKSKNN
ncbi:LPXTG cell wall anchor domain-containing protein, partial [Streptococcus infantis]|uniref:LPXTG cell wall anchor domain-containing protein n=1 Tax=Streptococcus infantis TaxID=68892 RepID=UPI0026E2BD92